jgi:hypothetical protein
MGSNFSTWLGPIAAVAIAAFSMEQLAVAADRGSDRAPHVEQHQDQTVSPVTINVISEDGSATRADVEQGGSEQPDLLARTKSYALAVLRDPVALFTFFLWAATMLLWWGADKTSKRQLRAYVCIRAGRHPEPNAVGDRYVITAKVVNTGATPAFDVQVWSEFQVIAVGDAGTYRFRQAPRRIDSAKFSIFPGSKKHRTGSSVPIRAEQGFAIERGDLRLYFWGEVRYRDIFKKSHCTRFRLYFHIEEGMGSWRYCDEGNGAT